MNSSTTTQGKEALRPAPVPDDEVPAHLRGTRAAIFHLLHVAQAPKEAVQTHPPTTPVAVIQPRSARPRQQSPALPTRGTGVQEFLYGDQFEFLSPDKRGVPLNVSTVTRHTQVLGEYARKAG